MPRFESTTIPIHTYGVSGPTVFVLHDGPGVMGDVAPLARRLADRFRAGKRGTVRSFSFKDKQSRFFGEAISWPGAQDRANADL